MGLPTTAAKYVWFSVAYGLASISVIQLLNLVRPSPGTCPSIGDNKAIMYATTYFEDDTLHIDYVNDHLKKCRQLKCIPLASKLREACFDKADAFIFSPVSEDMIWVLPMFVRRRRRKQHQLWIFKSLETPDTLGKLVPQGEAFFYWANGQFNLTLSYRTDADLPAPYRGRFQRILGKNPDPFQRQMYANKKRHIAAVISNCKDSWDRIGYLKELEKFGVSVDIYGKCGNQTCFGRVSDECFKQLEKDYYFYAALENSICRDYVTEKFYVPLSYNMVPLVSGGGDHARLGPPHSYIRWQDFSSPEQLAQRLLKIATNETAYAEFFSWKGTYRFPYGPPYAFGCLLCDAIHKVTPRTYKNRNIVPPLMFFEDAAFSRPGKTGRLLWMVPSLFR